MSVERAKDIVEAPQGDEIDEDRGSCSDLRLLASADTADLTALSAEVQAIAHRFNAEFEAVLAAGEADSGAGSAIVQRLLPTVVAVLEQLDEFYKDHAAYKAEVIQLREETTSLLSQLAKEKTARRDTEDLLMRMEDQFESERKILNEALAQNETQIRRLEMKSKNVEEQLARMEQKEQESLKENSKLHERINELLRSHAELNDSLKQSVAMPVYSLMKGRDSTTSRVPGNAFDTTSAGVGFDELSAMESDLSPPGDEDLAGMQGEVNNLIRENMELMETKWVFFAISPYTSFASRNALNVVKDDLLLQRDSLKADNQLLTEAVKQLTEKQTMLQQELINSDQMLTAARTEMEMLKAAAEKSRREAEMMRLITDRNHYKERFLELRDAIKLMEVIRASQRGHPELLHDLPPTVTDVQVHQNASPHHQLKSVFAKIMNLISLPRLDFGLDAMTLSDVDDVERRHEDCAEAKPVETTSGGGVAGPTFQSQRWIKIYQSSTTAPTFGWVRGFGRVRQGKAELSTAKNPTSLFSPVAHPVPKKCRSIGRSTLRIEQHLWLIGRGAASEAVPGRKKPKNVGKLYIFDPLQLNDALVSMDLDDDFLPISAGLFSVAEPLNDYRVLIAASDGRFLVCATTSNPDAVSEDDVWRVTLLSTFKLANPGEAATAIVSLDHRICLGVLNSAGSNQLVTLKWYLNSSTVPDNDIELNRVLRATALSLPSDSAAPSGPILLSSIFGRAFCCLGTAGGGALHRFDINADAFVAHLALPSQTPCLHAIAVGNEGATSSAETSPSTSRRLIWLAVSGQSPPTPTTQQRSSEEGGEGVYLGPLSRLLSVCAESHVFLHKIDLTSVLISMIDTTGVLDPVDLTVSRLLVQGTECIWFATRCGLIGRFLIAFLLNDAADGSPTEVLNQDAISLSCHAYRRPVSALIAIRNQEEGKGKDAATLNNQASFLVVAVGHDYAYLQTSSLTPRVKKPVMSGTATLPDGRLVDSLKVVELKKELEVLGLDKNGLKKDLVRRLSAALSDPVNMQPSSEVGFSEKVPNEMISSVVGFEGNSPSKLDAKSDRQSESDTDQDPPSEPDPSSKKSVEDIGSVSESNASVGGVVHSPATADQVEQAAERSISEKVGPQTSTEAAALQSETTNSQIAQEHTRGSSPRVVEVSVEIHEEEEDYGDEEEEEEEKVEKAREKKEAEKPVTLVDATPKTSPPKSGGIESSTFRKPASPPPPSNTPVPTSVRKETRAVGFTVEAPERVNPAAEAKCSPSSLVYIRCLVRPFTAAQLATMLETHFGRASELWLDRIKSTAVARFSNEEVAAKCREGLDGCRWPSINPRILQCEFASEALFAWLKEHGEAGDKPPPRHLLGGDGAVNGASANENNGSSVERKRPEKSMDDVEATSGAKRRRIVGGEGVTKSTEKEEGRSKRDTRGEESSKTLDDLFKKTAATPSVYWLPLTDEAAAAQLKARKQTYLAESTRRPVPKRNVEERRRENRSPFTGEFGNGPTTSASNPLLPPDASVREKRQRERSPSPGNKRALRERRRSPSPRRPRYANRTPSPRFGGSSFAASNTANAAATTADSRHPPPPSPPPNYRRRTPLRR
ncbi:C-Jun-amino-terminal kinase-interacting protein 3 [Taenia solium]|eukprot:TsM_000030000 transcript=TsM_000030000 gene=TsM_000030000